jgi:hypothetical protein
MYEQREEESRDRIATEIPAGRIVVLYANVGFYIQMVIARFRKSSATSPVHHAGLQISLWLLIPLGAIATCPLNHHLASMACLDDTARAWPLRYATAKSWLTPNALGLDPALGKIVGNARRVITLQFQLPFAHRTAGRQQFFELPERLRQLGATSWRSGDYRHDFAAPMLSVQRDADDAFGAIRA